MRLRAQTPRERTCTLCTASTGRRTLLWRRARCLPLALLHPVRPSPLRIPSRRCCSMHACLHVHVHLRLCLRLRVGAGKRCRSVPQLTVVPVTALAWTTVCTPVVLPPVPRWPSLLGPLAAVTSDCCDMDCGGLGTERGGGHALPFARRLLRAARCASCACGAAMGAAIFGTFLGPVVDKYGRRCVPSPLLSCPVFRRLIPTPETLNPKH